MHLLQEIFRVYWDKKFPPAGGQKFSQSSFHSKPNHRGGTIHHSSYSTATVYTFNLSNFSTNKAVDLANSIIPTQFADFFSSVAKITFKFSYQRRKEKNPPRKGKKTHRRTVLIWKTRKKLHRRTFSQVSRDFSIHISHCRTRLHTYRAKLRTYNHKRHPKFTPNCLNNLKVTYKSILNFAGCVRHVTTAAWRI